MLYEVITFSGQLDKTTLENMLYPDSFLYRELQEVTGKNALTVSTDEASNITISASTLNLDPLLSLQKKSAPARPLRPLVKQKHIFLNVDTLNYDQRVYQGVQAKVTIHQPATDIDITHALLCGLDLSGRITINYTGSRPWVLTRVFFKTDKAKQLSRSVDCLTGSRITSYNVCYTKLLRKHPGRPESGKDRECPGRYPAPAAHQP